MRDRQRSLAACAKMFELLIYEPLITSAGKYISINQHGFMPKISTTTNLMQFVSSFYKSIDDGMQVDAMYTGIKAAFDSVFHNILPAKLDRLGLSPPLVTWMKSYLCGRSYAVRMGSHQSRSIDASSGLPQGSNLGPLLFLLCINDFAWHSRTIVAYSTQMILKSIVKSVSQRTIFNFKPP